jgi:hypothetical protein
MDELTALVLAVGRIVRELLETEKLEILHKGIHADRAEGVVVVETVDVWGHRARLEHELLAHGYQVEIRHLIGAGRGHQIRVSTSRR